MAARRMELRRRRSSQVTNSNSRVPYRKLARSIMGQRHQLFLIARVRETPGDPKKYRCVATFHHQWCYGSLPLRCVSRFKHLASVKANADLIRRDLDGYHLGVQRSSEIPCPYISFLGGMAFSIDIERGYYSSIVYLPATMGCFDGDDNGDYVNIINASQYLRAYYPQNFDPLASDAIQKQQIRNDYTHTHLVGDLADMSILTLDVLAETWPKAYKSSAAETSSSDATWNVTDYRTPSPAPVDSPNEISLETIIESLRASHDSVVNLSNRALLPEDLLKILSDLPPFSRLDISRNSAIDKVALSQILREHRLLWLNIDGCGVSGDDVTDLLATQAHLFRGIEAIIHPTFLSRENLLSWDKSFKIKPLGIPSAFRFCYDFESHLSLPFFGSDQIVQALLQVAEARAHGKFTNYINSFTALQGLFGCSACYDGQPWGEREVQVIPPEIQGGDNRSGYRFVINTEYMVAGVAKPSKKKYHYGVVLPGDQEGFVDLATFFRHLEEEGWPKPRNQEAVARVIELFNRDGALLQANVEAVMKEVVKEVERLNRW
ncbi:hypothetical protein NMY22_g3276 [Coprinellus aureogranulatus]|nr:hypothetical protein NMY22_g3276 [Coprinellus aureogranulatus]